MPNLFGIVAGKVPPPVRATPLGNETGWPAGALCRVYRVTAIGGQSWPPPLDNDSLSASFRGRKMTEKKFGRGVETRISGLAYS